MSYSRQHRSILFLLLASSPLTNKDTLVPDLSKDPFFELIEGDPHFARNILLGEWHDYRNESLYFIHKISKTRPDFNTFLLEGAPNGSIQDCDNYGIRTENKPICIGWDSTEVRMVPYEKTYLSTCLNILNKIDSDHKSLKSDSNIDKYIENIAEQFRLNLNITKQTKTTAMQDIQETKQLQKNALQKVYFDFIVLLQKRRSKGESFAKILKEETNKYRREYEKFNEKVKSNYVNQKSINKRNELLLKTLKKQDTPTVVLAGKCHLFSKSQPRTNLCKDLHGQPLLDELKKHAHENPYSVLMTKRDPGHS